MKPDWITTKQAAALSGYTLVHVRHLITTHRIKSQRWGRDWQVEHQSLLAYVKAAKKLGAKRGPKRGA